MRILSLALASILLAGCTSSRLDKLLTQYERDGFSGTVLVAKNGRVLLHRGYGVADRERGIRNDTKTLFEVASLSKTFTAAALLDLESRGVLKSDDALSKHLGEFPPDKAAATIHHLATHTGGLVGEGTELAYGNDREAFVESVKNAPRESAPGERYRYTNAGYSMLAAVVEVASGESFEANVQKLIERAGLHDTYFRGAVPESVLPRIAKGYRGTPPNESVPPPFQWGVRGSGGMVMTVGDLYRWHLALHGGRVLGARALATMFYPWPEEGYGWHVTPELISKGGGMPEYASQLLFYPKEGVVIVWASNNLEKRWRQTLNRGIADLVRRRR
jgi:CubicO group peptidase (beta-lactamase class C family)